MRGAYINRPSEHPLVESPPIFAASTQWPYYRCSFSLYKSALPSSAPPPAFPLAQTGLTSPKSVKRPSKASPNLSENKVAFFVPGITNITFSSPKASQFYVDGAHLREVDFDIGPSWAGLAVMRTKRGSFSFGSSLLAQKDVWMI